MSIHRCKLIFSTIKFCYCILEVPESIKSGKYYLMLRVFKRFSVYQTNSVKFLETGHADARKIIKRSGKMKFTDATERFETWGQWGRGVNLQSQVHTSSKISKNVLSREYEVWERIPIFGSVPINYVLNLPYYLVI